MLKNLSVYINKNKIFDYDKTTRLPGKQRQYLDNMDYDMDQGIEINDKLISSPNKMQRANYVAMNLLHGIETDNKGLISATSAYLVNRIPDLESIQAVENGDEITMDLILSEVN